MVDTHMNNKKYPLVVNYTIGVQGSLLYTIM